MNNGPESGGSAEALKTIHQSPEFGDLWQLHYSDAGGKSLNAPEQFIANSDHCKGDWIRVTARQDGSFTVRNGRNQFEKSYPPRM